MLRIEFKETKNTVWDIRPAFRNLFTPEWMEDPLVKEMIMDVDKSRVESPYCIMSPVLGQIPPDTLSGGVKALILMLKTDYQIHASACGDDCAKWIEKIAQVREKEGKDLTISLEHYMDFDHDFSFYSVDEGRMIESYEDYTDEHGWIF